jgi:hypothetical protein
LQQEGGVRGKELRLAVEPRRPGSNLQPRSASSPAPRARGRTQRRARRSKLDREPPAQRVSLALEPSPFARPARRRRRKRAVEIMAVGRQCAGTQWRGCRKACGRAATSATTRAEDNEPTHSGPDTTNSGGRVTRLPNDYAGTTPDVGFTDATGSVK